MNRRQLLCATVLITSACAVPVTAQDLSGKTITIVYNFAAGSSGDASARLIAEKMRQSLNATVIVDNKAGGSGRIGVMAVKSAKPDGLTLLYTPFAPMTLYPHSYKQLGYDPFKDFKPVAIAGTNDYGLAVNPSLPVKTMGEFVEWLRKNPDKASYGTTGGGTVPHFLGVSLSNITGVPMTHIPFRGSGLAVTDIIGGNLPFMITTTSDLTVHAKAGKIRVLGTSGKQRTHALPDVLTFKEQGIALEAVGWYGFFAPAGTPDAVVAKLSNAITAGVKSPEVAEKLLNMGLNPEAFSAADLAVRHKADSERWEPVIKASGFTPDQ